MTRLEALDAAEEQKSGTRFACAMQGQYVLHARRHQDGSESMIQMLLSSSPTRDIKEPTGFVLLRGDDPDLQSIQPEHWPLVDTSLDWKPVARYED